MSIKTSAQTIVAKDKHNNSWNKYLFTWELLHSKQSELKVYEVVLQATVLSGKRVVYVNGNQRLSENINFGFKRDFLIGQTLDGRIQQIGLSIEFQLYVNGKSFKQLSQREYKYQPVNLLFEQEIDKHQRAQIGQKIDAKEQFTKKLKKPGDQKNKKEISNFGKTPILQQEKVAQTIKVQKIQKSQTYFVKPLKEQQSTQDAIKDTQKQLMKILMQGKKKK